MGVDVDVQRVSAVRIQQVDEAALMVLPVSAAGRLAWSMRSTLVLSTAIGVPRSLAKISWDDAGEKGLLPGWRESVKDAWKHLKGITPAGFPDVDLTAVGKRFDRQLTAAQARGVAMLRTDDGLLILGDDDYAVLGERDFGMPGLRATESIGPFVELQSTGPLIMVHDALVEPHMGIGHHPPRHNERLFYILEGAVDHDDALNDIAGHMSTGDVGRLTEGMHGMLHKEWNNPHGRARAFILVYRTEPVPPTASFALLADTDAPRYPESSGVTTKELVGERSPLHIHGDIRLFTDSTLETGADLITAFAAGEGGLLVPLEGRVELLGGLTVTPPEVVLAPPGSEAREVRVRALERVRVLRVVHGPGRA